MTADDSILRGLLANPSLPTDLMLHLIEHADPAVVARALSSRVNLPDAAVAALARHPDARLRRAVIEMPNVADADVVRLIQDPERRIRRFMMERAYMAYGLPEQAYVVLAADPDPGIRAWLAALPDLPAQVVPLLADDPEHGDLVVLRLGAPDAAHAAYLRLLAHEDPHRRRTALSALGHVPPPHLLAKLLDDPATRAAAIPHADLDPELAARLAHDPDRAVRQSLAAHPALSPAQFALLADDPEATVRATLAEHARLPDGVRERLAADEDRAVRRAVLYSEHTPDGLRERIDYPLGRHERASSVAWLRRRCEDTALQARYARSAQAAYRRTVARCPHLDTGTVALLADDEDFAVRLLLAENHPDAPPHLLARMVHEWGGYSIWRLMRHPNFPADVIDEFSRSGDNGLHWCAVFSDRLTEEQKARLRTSPDSSLRRHVDPDLPPVADLLTMLTDAESTVREQAARHHNLPVDSMRQLVAAATDR